MTKVGKFDEEPDEKHGNKGKKEDKGTEQEIHETLEVFSGTEETGSRNADGRGVADKLKFAELGGEGEFRRDKIIEKMTVERLFINIFRVFFFSLENDVRVGAAESFF